MQAIETANKICILIPTYNNHKTLQRILNGVLQYSNHIIVVNDGSTDSTPQILKKYSEIEVITFSKNNGKGKALEAGFKKALQLGYNYAITIDSDGQHYPSDLPFFINEIEQSETPILLIGSRNMAHDSVPKKSSFGNKFSNFWFKFETGIALSDTQSGYRAYPLQFLPNKFYTSKFEFEIEVIVRTAWKGITVKNIPIQVLYDPSERVSHFRPFRDFTRISILNTVLVCILFVYIKPRNFIRFYKNKNIRHFIKNEIFAINDSPKIKALSAAIGIFIGLSPFWGFHLALVIALSMLLRLNKIITFAFSNISIPPMIPFVLYASVWVGNKIYPADIDILDIANISLETIKNSLAQYFIGSLFLAFFCAIITGFVSYFLFTIKWRKAQE